MQQNTTPKNIINSIISKADSINIALRHLLLEVIDKRFNKKKTLLNCFNRFLIKNLSNPANFVSN